MGRELAQADQRSNDLSLRMASIRSDYQRIAAEEYKDASARLVQLREQSRTADDAARRKAVVAPAAGTVVGLRVSAPGEVAPGKGTMDYATYLRRLAQLPQAPPLMIEHLSTAEEYAGARDHIFKVGKQEGLSFGGDV